MKKILICILVVLGCFFIDHESCRHQNEIDQIDLNDCQKLMIVAHPDDETIWGTTWWISGM